MEQILIEAAKQVPALVVLTTFVVLVLKHLREKDKASSQSSKERDDQFLEALRERDARFLAGMQSMSERVESSSDKSTRVVERNSEVMARVVVVLDRVESRLERHEEDEIRRNAIAEARKSSGSHTAISGG